MYEMTTTARRIAIAIEIGNTRCADAALTPTSTTRADSVAYATEESGSEAKIGSASHLGRRVSSICPVRIGRPTTSRRARRGGPEVPGGGPRRSRLERSEHARDRPRLEHVVLAVEGTVAVAQQLVEEEDPGSGHRPLAGAPAGERAEESGILADGRPIERRGGRKSLGRGGAHDASDLTLPPGACPAR